MKEITAHKVGAVNETITIEALGLRASRGAHHLYRVMALGYPGSPPLGTLLPFAFDGHGGLTNEALLAVVLDRLQDFQAGSFPCQENQDAVLLLQVALRSLQRRANETPPDDPPRPELVSSGTDEQRVKGPGRCLKCGRDRVRFPLRGYQCLACD